MTYSITITDKKEAITIADGMITMTGSEPPRRERGQNLPAPLGGPHTRVHVHGTQGVHYAKDGPVTFAMGETVTLSWGVIGKHGIYDNRQITLTAVGDVVRVTYRALFTVDVVADEPVTYTVYRYRDEWRFRKER
jgi:hypothetical protein